MATAKDKLKADKGKKNKELEDRMPRIKPSGKTPSRKDKK